MSLPVALLAACLLSAALCRVLIWLAPKDAPDGDRKLQLAPVPTSGGLAIALAVAAGLVLAGQTGLVAGTEPVATAWLCAFVLMLGATDDTITLPTRLKFALLAAACLLASAFGLQADAIFLPVADATFVLPAALAIAGTALWIFVLVNAANFMDGSNGLAMGMLAIACLALAARTHADPGFVFWTACLFAAAIAGFLVWNLQGRLFAGDSGSLFGGGLFAALSVIAAADGNVWFPATLVLPILVDVFLTLLWRARRGENILTPHREHAYQWMIRRGAGHLSVALAYWALTAACCGLALWAAGQGKAASAAMFAALLLAGSLLWAVHRRRVSAAAKGDLSSG